MSDQSLLESNKTPVKKGKKIDNLPSTEIGNNAAIFNAEFNKVFDVQVKPKEHLKERSHRHLIEKEKQAHQQKLEWFAWRVIFFSIPGFGALCLLIALFSSNPDVTKGALGLLASIVSGFFGYLAGRGSNK